MDPITNIALLLRGWLRIQKDLVTGLPLNSWSKRFLKTFILRFLMIPQTQQHAKLPPKHVKIAQFSPPKNYSQFLHLKQKKLRGCWLAASLKLVLKGFFSGNPFKARSGRNVIRHPGDFVSWRIHGTNRSGIFTDPWNGWFFWSM